MKKYKVLFLIVFMFILSGCNINYSVNIKSNGKVEEKFVMTFDEKDVDSHNPKALINDTIKTYKENGMYKDYSFKVNLSGKNSTITAYRKYNSLNEYISKSELLPSIFEKTSYIDDYGIKGLITTGEYYYDALFDKTMVTVDEPTIENVDINIHSQFDLLENNASNIDDNNTMHWNINDENKTFSINFKYNNSKRYDIIIKDYLKENWISIIIVGLVIVSIIIVINYIKNQDKLNNKI